MVTGVAGEGGGSGGVKLVRKKEVMVKLLIRSVEGKGGEGEGGEVEGGEVEGGEYKGDEGEGGKGDGVESEGCEDGEGEIGEGKVGDDEVGGSVLVGVLAVEEEEEEGSLLTQGLQSSIWGIALF